MIKSDEVNLIIFGGKSDVFPEKIFKIHNFNEINNDKILQKLYSAADVMIVPSKMETFGLAATEAMACGTPVVAFNNTGLADIMEHKKNGYLAELLDINDLAKGILWTFNHSDEKTLSLNARKRAETIFLRRSSNKKIS